MNLEEWGNLKSLSHCKLRQPNQIKGAWCLLEFIGDGTLSISKIGMEFALTKREVLLRISSIFNFLAYFSLTQHLDKLGSCDVCENFF